MNFFERELRTMFEHTNVIDSPVFAGKCLLGRLDDDLRVKLQFITVLQANYYTAIQIDIINRKEGIVDKQILKFADITGRTLHIWEDNGEATWCCDVTPKDKACIADTVLSYVEMFQSQSMTMGGPSM